MFITVTGKARLLYAVLNQSDPVPISTFYFSKFKFKIAFLCEDLKGKDNFRDTDVDDRLTEWVLDKYCVGLWTGFIWLRTSFNGDV
jgi:hypothetical protein